MRLAVHLPLMLCYCNIDSLGQRPVPNYYLPNIPKHNRHNNQLFINFQAIDINVEIIELQTPTPIDIEFDFLSLPIRSLLHHRT